MIKLCWHECCSGEPPWTYVQTEASTYLTLSQENEAVHTGGFASIEGLIHLQTLLPDSCPWQKTPPAFSNQLKTFCLRERCCWASAGREILRASLPLHTVVWGQCRCWKDLCYWTSSHQCPWKLCLDWEAEVRGFWQTDSLCEKKGANLVVPLFEGLPRAAWRTRSLSRFIITFRYFFFVTEVLRTQ